MERGARKSTRSSVVCDAFALTVTLIIFFSVAILLGQAKPLDPPSSSSSRASSKVPAHSPAQVSLVGIPSPTNLGLVDQQSRSWMNSAQLVKVHQGGSSYHQAHQPQPAPGYSSTPMAGSTGLSQAPVDPVMRPAVTLNVLGGSASAEEASPVALSSSSSGFIRLQHEPVSSGRVYNFNSHQQGSSSGSSAGYSNGWAAATGKSASIPARWPEVVEENPVHHQYQQHLIHTTNSLAIQRISNTNSQTPPPANSQQDNSQQQDLSRRRIMVEYHNNKNAIETSEVHTGTSSLPTIITFKGTSIATPTTSAAGRLTGILAERVVTSDFEMWELNSACTNSKNQQQLVSSTMGVTKRNQDYVNNYIKTILQTIDRIKDPLHNYAIQYCGFINQTFEAWESSQPEDPCVPTPVFAADRGISRGYSFETLKEAFLKVQVYTLAQRVTHDVLLGSNPRPSSETADSLRDITCNLKRMRDTIKDVLMYEMDFEVPTSTSTPYDDDDIKAQCCIPQQYCVKTMTLLLTTKRFLQNLHATWVS